MNIIALTKMFSEMLDNQVYAINFPAYTKGNFIKLEITSGVQELGGVMDFNVQFMTKANHPAEAEGVALNIIYKLDMVTDIEFCEGKYQLILAKASSTQPYFVGETDSDEFVFSVDFRLLVSRL